MNGRDYTANEQIIMEQHLLASLLAALIGGIVDLDSTAAVQIMISQPIAAAPITGLALGALCGDTMTGLHLGLMVGVILQLVWIEQLPLGMNVPPDAALASVLSVSLGFLAGRSYGSYVEREFCYTAALLFSVVLGLLGRGLDKFVRRLNTSVDNWVSYQIEDLNFKAITFGHLFGLVFTFTKAFIFCFLVAWFGVEPLKYFTNSLNLIHAKGFVVVQGLLPAVGFAVLANMCLKDKNEIKYFIGAIAAFTFLPSSVWLGLAFAAVVMYKTRPIKPVKKNKKKNEHCRNK